MKKQFLDWFSNQQVSNPELNLGNIKKLLYGAFIVGFDSAYPKGYRSGYDDRDKEDGPPAIITGPPENPTPEMLDAGGRRIVDWETSTPQEKEQSRITAERVWRVMYHAK
jgi:hypothetical protein